MTYRHIEELLKADIKNISQFSAETINEMFNALPELRALLERVKELQKELDEERNTSSIADKCINSLEAQLVELKMALQDNRPQPAVSSLLSILHQKEIELAEAKMQINCRPTKGDLRNTIKELRDALDELVKAGDEMYSAAVYDEKQWIHDSRFQNWCKAVAKAKGTK